jgi:hypothetical protein
LQRSSTHSRAIWDANRKSVAAVPEDSRRAATGKPVNGADRDMSPPHSLDAEQAVLGGLLLGAPWLEDLVPEDFYLPVNQTVAKAMTTLAAQGKPIQLITMEEQLQQMGELQNIGGLAYLGTLARDATIAGVEAAAEIVRDHAVRREAIKLVQAVDRMVADQKLQPAAAIIDRILRTGERLNARLRPHALEAEPLNQEPVSAWSTQPLPAARDWVISRLIPGRRVTTLLANGGLGKSTVAVQVGVHVSLNLHLFGLEVSGGRVLGIFCEDETEELQRRVRAACAAERVELEQVDQFVAISREGQDNLLCTFEHDQIVFTPFYRQVEATLAAFRPRLVILDTLADLFAGDLMSTVHVRQFIKFALGGLCVRHDCAVLLIAHPSASGMNSGDGGGFSTAWNNAVRSRLYLRYPTGTDPEAIANRRVLEVRKANYGPSGVSVPLLWQAGAFIVDPEPIEEATGQKPPRAAVRADTRMSLAVMEHFGDPAASSQVVTFRTIFEAMQKHGLIAKGGDYETDRKPLQRTLKQLVADGLIIDSKVPRGYRMAPQATQPAPE